MLTHFFDYFLQQLYFVQSFIHPLLFSLITNGILKGCLSVLQFLPLILVLFFFLSCLEESGYLSRVAVLMDQPLKRIGCTGKSFVPLLLGLGCSVPAILATRILKNSNERKHIIFLLPFLSCSAKIPVYSFFAFLFFPNYALFILFLLYFSGLFLGSFLLSLLPKENNSFILELPPYRFPSIKNTFRLIKEKTKEFMNKVFSLLLILHVFLWFIQSFTFHFTYTTNPTVSMLYVLAQSISWIFQPLGFNDWRITTALITGFTAKEAILSTLSILFQSSDITQFLSPSSAFSLLLFILLYSPCIATISITMKEAGIKTALFMILFQCLIAWIVAFVFFQLTQFF